MNPTILELIQLILGIGEAIVPIFIHNPNSQKVEGVIITNLNGVLNSLVTTPTIPNNTSTTSNTITITKTAS